MPVFTEEFKLTVRLQAGSWVCRHKKKTGSSTDMPLTALERCLEKVYPNREDWKIVTSCYVGSQNGWEVGIAAVFRGKK